MLDELLNKENKEEKLEKIEVIENPISEGERQFEEIPTDEEINKLNNQEEARIEEKKSSIDPSKKCILFLINGLGSASKDSFNINYQDIMPNMSMLMSNYLYTSLQNVNYNYKNGFRNFSLGNDLLPTYHRLENDTNIQNNGTINAIATDAVINHTKVHLFCFLDNEQVIKQVKKLIDVLTPKGNFKIFIHIILRQKDVKVYDDVIDKIKKIDESLTLISNVKIGTVVGERKINDEAFYTLMSKENGEKWPDYNRKLRFCEAQNIIPLNIEPFYLNSGFMIERNDVALFLNYEDVNCDGFISKITNVKLYTLFPMKSYSYAINIYEELEPTTYFSKVLEENNLSCLILTTEDRIDSISYNLCGLKDIKSKNIVYDDIRKKDLNIKEIVNSDYNYIIFDYDLENFKEIRKIKEFLMMIDNQINDIYTICEANDYKMFISSLYGIYKKFIVGIDKEVFLDYSIEVPAIIIDRNLPRSKFMFKYGTTHNLSNTIFNLITKNENIETSIRKRGILSFFKD